MNTLFKAVGLAILVLIIIVAASAFSFLIRGGAFNETSTVALDECWSVATGIGSAEDIDLDRAAGVAYLSALDRRGLVSGNNVTGTILKLDLNKANSVPIPAVTSVPDGFRPHGISLYESQDGVHYLFVINHSGGTEERVEIFRKNQQEELFSLIETIVDPLITHPNDLVAVGPRQFYIANDSGASNPIERAAEMILGVGLSPLVYYDGTDFTEVDTGLRSSGGINADLAMRLLYVGETMGEAIRVYELEEDGSLAVLKDEIQLDSAVDNIDLDPEGNLWIANHSNTLALVRHFGNASSHSPSQVQMITLGARGYGPISTVFESHGEDISAASVGLYYNDLLVMGSITEPFVRVCRL